MKFDLSWKVLVVANLFLGLFLWFLFSTDYSLIGTIPDILFPPIVGIVALVSWGSIKTSNKPQSFLIRLAHLPSAIGGGLYILTALVMLIPPFTLGAMFAVSEIVDERQIQQATSPDGTQIAYVYFRGVGAYSGGNGRIFVRVRRSALPLLERDIFYLRVSNASEDSANYIKWHGNDTIYISEIKNEISVGVIEAEVPQVIALPYGIIRFLSAIAEQTKINQQQTIPVRDVPVYPGDIFSNQSQFLEEENTVFRSFNVEQEDIETVEEWYEEILAKPPWNLVQVNRYTETEVNLMHIRYCVQATRDTDNERRIYYWEFMGSNDLSRGVHINIGTPNPITDTCKRYVDKP